jgi:dCTP deaminase
MLKNDKWIIEQANRGMITPFIPQLVRSVAFQKVISFGVSSYGYDLRLSEKDFRIFKHVPGEIIDPKRFNPNFLEKAELFHDDTGSYFIIPGNSYALGVALERIEIPDNITVICMGKSTYARCGIIANLTPGEAGWKGNLTLEFSNSSSADARIYANEGVVQLLFLEGEPCQTTYSDRNGKYQNQPQEVTLARV